MNVDGKQYLPNKKQDPKDDKQQKYFRSNLMDKIVFTSTNATLGQMNRFYHLGILNEDKLHLNSIESILQMKPSFEYFDIYEKKVKDLKEANQAGEAGKKLRAFVDYKKSTNHSKSNILKIKIIQPKKSLKTKLIKLN